MWKWKWQKCQTTNYGMHIFFEINPKDGIALVLGENERIARNSVFAFFTLFFLLFRCATTSKNVAMACVAILPLLLAALTFVCGFGRDTTTNRKTGANSFCSQPLGIAILNLKPFDIFVYLLVNVVLLNISLAFA